MHLRSLVPRPGRLLDFVLNLVHKLGLFAVARYFTPRVLTVLNYHRIDDPLRPGFDTFKSNVSATPAEFVRQMDYVCRNYNAITGEHLLDWLHGRRDLPSHPLIITFDDGYHDNLEFALPVLMARNLPALIFLTTGFIGGCEPLYWDYVAYLFFHTQKMNLHLPPPMGTVSWSTTSEREKIMLSWIGHVKTLPEEEKEWAVDELACQLAVAVPENFFDSLYLNWDQVCQMAGCNIEFGSHTVNHPILTRIMQSQVEEELGQSKQKIERETGRPVFAFAYPNGQSADFSQAILETVRSTGFEMAFTLLPGPTRLGMVRKNPLTIRRIFLMYTDTFPRFVAKLFGLGQWI
jgi:peptidoglycan/xylan/chitin deacetylase (PgdA/CDA1 family)